MFKVRNYLDSETLKQWNKRVTCFLNMVRFAGNVFIKVNMSHLIFRKQKKNCHLTLAYHFITLIILEYFCLFVHFLTKDLTKLLKLALDLCSSCLTFQEGQGLQVHATILGWNISFCSPFQLIYLYTNTILQVLDLYKLLLIYP